MFFITDNITTSYKIQEFQMVKIMVLVRLIYNDIIVYYSVNF